VDALQKLFRAPLTPGVHPGGQNIAYDLALVKLGPHTKFGEDWSNGVYFYTGHTHKHGFNVIYKVYIHIYIYIYICMYVCSDRVKITLSVGLFLAKSHVRA
jgi:hypothetical protein